MQQTAHNHIFTQAHLHIFVVRPQSHFCRPHVHNFRLQNAHNHISHRHHTNVPTITGCKTPTITSRQRHHTNVSAVDDYVSNNQYPSITFSNNQYPNIKYNMARTLFTARTTPRIFYVKTTKDISQSNCKLAGWRNTVLLWCEWLEMNVCTQIKLVINAVSHNIFGLRRDLLFYTKIPELLS